MFRSKPALRDPVSHGGRIVVVVGAGASGLAAAQRLIGASYDVEVVEARDRIGGRTHNEVLDGVTLDLGGSWLHDGEANYLRSAADASGLSLHRTDFNCGVILHDGGLTAVDADAVMWSMERPWRPSTRGLTGSDARSGAR